MRESQSSPGHCPQCGAELPPGAICPVCAFGAVAGAGAPGESPLDLADIPLPAGAVPPLQPSATGKPGDKVGPYKLLELVGEGGCGVVYVAEQEQPVRRRVALKVIKLGMDTREVIARFEAERQALALMDHPNIAKVLDAGATASGRPYFAMELVKGIRITDYCDRNNLSTPERLALFVQVCHAIQHAHQKGIIHRDIKPSNILITLHDGVPVPKVIDFGIAKATTNQRLTDKTVYTAMDQFIGTPAYMSPEQAELSGLDIDTRSDIYALGVLLYELLTGKTPFDSKRLVEAGLHEIRRIIREEDPPRPSTRVHTLTDAEQTTIAKHRHVEPPKLLGILRGDLDWIVMKSLEKDRTRRYETSNGLAADIQRYLGNEPVVARPPSTAYRLQKAIRRNRLAFAAASAVVLVLVLGLAATTWQTLRATKAEREQTRLLQRTDVERLRALEAEKQQRALRQEALASMAVAQIAQADSMLQEGNQHPALAKLASVLRADPENQIAANWITQLLLRRRWALPEEIRQTPATLQSGSWLLEKFGLGLEITSDGRFIRRWSVSGMKGFDLFDEAKLSLAVLDAVSGMPVIEPLGFEFKDINRVIGGALSSDGQWLTIGGGLWNLRNGKSLGSLIDALEWNTNGVPDEVRAQFSKSGDFLLLFAKPSGVSVWTLGDRTRPRLLLNDKGPVTFAALSHEGSNLLVVDGERAQWRRVLDNLVIREIPIPQANGKQRRVVAASDDLDLLLLQDEQESTLAIWHTALGGQPINLSGTKGPVLRADFRQELGLIAFVCGDLATDSTDANEKWPIQEYAYSLDGESLAQSEGVVSLTRGELVGSDGCWLALNRSYSSGASAVQLSRLFAPLASDLLLWDPNGTYNPAFLPSGRVRTISGAGRLTDWSYPYGGASYAAPSQIPFRDTQMAILADLFPDVLLASRLSQETGVVSIPVQDAVLLLSVDPTAGEMPSFSSRGGKFPEIIFSRDGARLAALFADGGIEVRSARDATLIASLNTASRVRQVAFDAGCQRLAAVDDKGGVVVVHLADTNQAFRLSLPEAPVFAATFNPADGTLATLHRDGVIAAWAAESTNVLSTLILSNSPSQAEFVDGQNLVVACVNGDVVRCRWEAERFQPVATRGLGERIVALDTSPRGHRVLAMSAGQQIGIWDLERDVWHAVSRQPRIIEKLGAIDGSRAFARFSPDGRWIATGVPGGGLQLLAAETGQPACETFWEHRGVFDGGLHAGGTKLIAVGNDMSLAAWDLPCLGIAAPAWWADFAEQVAGCRYTTSGQFGGVERMARRELMAWVGRQPPSDYKRVAVWFLNDPDSRTATPTGKATLLEKLTMQMSNGWPVVLSDALSLPRSQGEFLARVAKHVLKYERHDAKVMSALATVWAPDNPAVWTARAEILAASTNIAEGLRVVDRALKLDTNNAAAWLARGRLLVGANRLKEAVESFDRCIRLAPATEEGRRINQAAVQERSSVEIPLGLLTILQGGPPPVKGDESGSDGGPPVGPPTPPAPGSVPKVSAENGPRHDVIPEVFTPNILSPPSANNAFSQADPGEVTPNATPAPTSPPPYQQVYVLAVGVNKNPGLENLRFARKDAEAVADVLRDFYGFSSNTVFVLLDEQATKKAITDRLAEIQAKIKPTDDLIFFFSGHGISLAERQGPAGKSTIVRSGFLVPYDPAIPTNSTIAEWRERAIDVSWLVTQLVKAPARHRLLLLDSCFSGLAFTNQPVEVRPLQDLYAKVIDQPTVQIMTAGLDDEKPHDEPDLQHGLFTYALLAQLRRPGVRTVEEIFFALREDVIDEVSLRKYLTPMTPQFRSVRQEGDGTFVFVPADRRQDWAAGTPRSKEYDAAKGKGYLQPVQDSEVQEVQRLADSGQAPAPDWQDKVDRYEARAAMGDPNAMAALAKIYQQGVGVKPNPKLAGLWANEGAQTLSVSGLLGIKDPATAKMLDSVVHVNIASGPTGGGGGAVLPVSAAGTPSAGSVEKVFTDGGRAVGGFFAGAFGSKQFGDKWAGKIEDYPADLRKVLNSPKPNFKSALKTVTKWQNDLAEVRKLWPGGSPPESLETTYQALSPLVDQLSNTNAADSRKALENADKLNAVLCSELRKLDAPK